MDKAEEAIWSSSRCSVGGKVYDELAVARGDLHFFPMETSTLDEIRTKKSLRPVLCLQTK